MKHRDLNLQQLNKFLCLTHTRFFGSVPKLFLLLIFTNYLQANSIPYADNLCYVRDQATQIKVSPSFNPNNLSFEDKLLFNLKSSTVKVSGFLSDSDYTRNLEYLEHENLVTGYVDLPYLISTNSLGTTSLYTMDNKSYKGGWIGSVYINNPKYQFEDVIYHEDSKRNIGTKHVNRSERDRSWETKYNAIKEDGLIRQYSWLLPTTQAIQQFVNAGYILNVNNQKSIVISNSTTTFSWDIINKEMVITSNTEDGALTNRIIRKFTYNSELNVDLLESSTIQSYSSFSTGDCYQEVVVTTYTDYNTSCGDNINLRESEPIATKEILQLSIYPNPTSDVVNITTPTKSSGVLEIISSTGEKIHYRRFENDTELNLNVSQYPDGMYLARIVSDENVQYQSKFIKQ